MFIYRYVATATKRNLIKHYVWHAMHSTGFFQGRGLVDRKLVKAPSNFIAGRPKAALLFWFLVVLDVVFRYLSLFLLYII